MSTIRYLLIILNSLKQLHSNFNERVNCELKLIIRVTFLMLDIN
jgi:hypothetical protein